MNNWFERTLGQENSRIDERYGTFSIATDKGKTRQLNEDFALVATINNGEPIFVALVADGIGGLSDGQLASRRAAGYFIGELADDIETSEKLDSKIGRALIQTNRKVYGDFREKSGTTIAGLIVAKNGRSIVFSIGDSLVYVLAQEGGLSRVNDLDTLGDAIASHKTANNSHNPLSSSLLQFVGMRNEVEPNLQHFKNLPRAALVASDGIASISDSQLQKLFVTATSISDMARRTVIIADWLGGQDNATVVAISLKKHFNQFLESSPIPGLRIWDISGELTLPFYRSKGSSKKKQEKRKSKGDPKLTKKKANDESLEEKKQGEIFNAQNEPTSFEIKDD